jgi:hypothetical protein
MLHQRESLFLLLETISCFLVIDYQICSGYHYEFNKKFQKHNI